MQSCFWIVCSCSCCHRMLVCRICVRCSSWSLIVWIAPNWLEAVCSLCWGRSSCTAVAVSKAGVLDSAMSFDGVADVESDRAVWEISEDTEDVWLLLSSEVATSRVLLKCCWESKLESCRLSTDETTSSVGLSSKQSSCLLSVGTPLALGKNTSDEQLLFLTTA